MKPAPPVTRTRIGGGYRPSTGADPRRGRACVDRHKVPAARTARGARANQSPWPRTRSSTNGWCPHRPRRSTRSSPARATYPRWWGDAFLEGEGDPGPAAPGKRARLLTRGRLPYRLRWDLVCVEADAAAEARVADPGRLRGRRDLDARAGRRRDAGRPGMACRRAEAARAPPDAAPARRSSPGTTAGRCAAGRRASFASSGGVASRSRARQARRPSRQCGSRGAPFSLRRTDTAGRGAFAPNSAVVIRRTRQSTPASSKIASAKSAQVQSPSAARCQMPNAAPPSTSVRVASARCPT